MPSSSSPSTSIRRISKTNPANAVAHRFIELPTDGPVVDTRQRLSAYLRDLDMLGQIR